MSKLRIEVDTATIKKLVMDHIQEKLGSTPYVPDKVVVQVQSKQNYRVHEWEVGEFRAILEVDV